jgi:hypothetical protein
MSESRPPEQAVLIYLDGLSLPDEIYEEYDLMTLEDAIIAELERQPVGELDGNEFGPGETTLFLYGPDAEALWRAIEPAVTPYPLCRGARVVVRYGEPGAPLREFSLPA